MKFLVLALVASWIPGAFSLSGVSCDDGWQLHNMNCYKFIDDYPTTHDAAAHMCMGHGANLVYGTNPEEMRFLGTTVQQKDSYGWWTGLIRRGSDIYKQVSGNSATDKMSIIPMDKNESLILPTTQASNEKSLQCVAWTYVRSSSAQLTHEPCRVRLPYVCTGDVQNVPNADYSNTDRWKLANDTVYYFSRSDDMLPYDEAKQKCMDKGMSLMIFNTKTIFDFLMKELSRPTKPLSVRVWWTGVLRDGNTGYKWSDGSANLNFVNQLKRARGDQGRQSYILLTAIGKSRYLSSGVPKALPFICKKSAIGAGGVNFGCPASWLRAGQSCYFFPITLPVTQDDASKKCQAFGGHLLTVDSKDELTWLSSSSVVPFGAWTSLNDKQNKGTFVWHDGSKIDPTLVRWGSPLGNYRGLLSSSVSLWADQGRLCTVYQPSLNRLLSINCDQSSFAGCSYKVTQGVSCLSPWKQFQDTCYYAADKSITSWAISLSVCYKALPDSVDDSKIRMDYINIESKAVADFLSTTFKSSPNFWTGLSTVRTAPLLKWTDSTDVDLTIFSNSQNADGSCATITEGGYFNHLDCNEKESRLICEKEIAFKAPPPSVENQTGGGAGGMHTWTTQKHLIVAMFLVIVYKFV